MRRGLPLLLDVCALVSSYVGAFVWDRCGAFVSACDRGSGTVSYSSSFLQVTWALDRCRHSPTPSTPSTLRIDAEGVDDGLRRTLRVDARVPGPGYNLLVDLTLPPSGAALPPSQRHSGRLETTPSTHKSCLDVSGLVHDTHTHASSGSQAASCTRDLSRHPVGLLTASAGPGTRRSCSNEAIWD